MPITAAGANAMGQASANNANNLNQSWMQQAMEFNSRERQLNREFQERMSNTAYQRAVTDMKQAGINPILAAQLGGASTPSGGAATRSQSSRQSASMMADNMSEIGTVITEVFSGLAKALNLGNGDVTSATENIISSRYTWAKEGFSSTMEKMYDYFERSTNKE